jgi:hypothetical protein
LSPTPFSEVLGVPAQGIFAVVAVTDKTVEHAELGHGMLSYPLLAAANGVQGGPLHGQLLEPADSGGAVDVIEWFHYAEEQATRLRKKLSGIPLNVQSIAQAQKTPILVLDR